MEQANIGADKIKLATGWERGADKKWRYEIPDGDFTESITKMIDTQKKNNIPETW